MCIKQNCVLISIPLTQGLQDGCHASGAPVFEAPQDGDGVDNGGLADVDLLEPPFERWVLLDVLPILVLPCQVRHLVSGYKQKGVLTGMRTACY